LDLTEVIDPRFEKVECHRLQNNQNNQHSKIELRRNIKDQQLSPIGALLLFDIPTLGCQGCSAGLKNIRDLKEDISVEGIGF
jgi:hypothetical protein